MAAPYTTTHCQSPYTHTHTHTQSPWISAPFIMIHTHTHLRTLAQTQHNTQRTIPPYLDHLRPTPWWYEWMHPALQHGWCESGFQPRMRAQGCALQHPERGSVLLLRQGVWPVCVRACVCAHVVCVLCARMCVCCVCVHTKRSCLCVHQRSPWPYRHCWCAHPCGVCCVA